ncbi:MULTISPECIES: nicotinate-nucleotide--dimethylbenzimidazole phosphoribosyltransferase [Streptomyces]|uniref:nicotinate-nucleotide--dimethylbenzimidazole phosphoribosyltransferase n=1 Tax=Streptomyces TaxID=1883 RepID=UPI0022492752|nr:nicotinate-nucleotide--dimethylbenzimidazole phosphoribosyltransferase [Streptomyces sp. JHD 1]MCX2970332.1 nicotinate-nucleotide--dimethylbenzimidazole phosphoribosyltransferase [Streptomyces sp. JHD 1]
MTDTGQVPGEGQPENAGAQPDGPGTPASGTYTYADPDATPPAGEDDDMLLMPGAQGAWSESAPAAPPRPPHTGAPEADGRDPGYAEHGPAPAHTGGRPAPRRPLHLGPPVPEHSGAVRSLADRGPTTPGPVPAEPAAEPGPVPAEHAAPPVGEYPDGGYPPAASAPTAPGFEPPHVAPAQPGAWHPAPQPPDAGAETVDHPVPVPEAVADEPATAPPVGAPQAEAGRAYPVEPPHAVEPRPADAAPPADGPYADAEHRAAPEAAPQPAPAASAADGAVPVEGSSGPVAQPPLPQDAPPADGDQPEAGAPPHPVAETDGTDTAPPAGAPEPPAAVPPSGAAEARPTVAPEPAPGTEPAPEPTAAQAPEPVAPAPEADATPAPEPHVTAYAPAAGSPSAHEPESGPGQGQPEEAAEPGAADAAPAEPVAAEPGEPVVAGPGTVPGAHAAPESEPEPQPEPGEAPQTGPEPQAGPEPEPGEAARTAPEPQAAPEPTPPTGPEPQAAPGPEAGAEPEPEVVPGEAPQTGPEPQAGPEPEPEPEPEPRTAQEPQPDAEPPVPPAPATPPAPGYPDAEREALHRVMRERRDIRNGFRPDPIPHEVLLRVLEAAHTAPSVGHSQPWDFVLIRAEETRRKMHELAVRQREVYARSLPRARAKQFKELKVEAILDTPVNIVVTADPTRGGRHTLGRHSQPQMAPYSSALAVENLWLAARAEGLGVGWVSFFDEREMVTELGLPEHLEVVAYLCVGYVDAFPEEPELARSGWSKRRPLAWVVHEEAYGRRALPGAEPSDLLAEALAGIRPLDAKALGEAWERQKRMTKPAGALGMLEIISAQLSGLARQCPPPVPEPAAVAVFAGDHGVHAQGVTAWPQEVTAQMVANFLGGGAVCNAFANQVGAEVCVVDVGVAGELPSTPGLLPRKVRPGTADITTGPAMDRSEALRAIEVGIETARDLVTAGNRALLTGEMGIANTTASAALIAVFTGADPAEVTGRGTGISDETHARKVDVVRRALQLHQPDAADPIGVLTALGGLEHAAMVGLILGGASLRTPVILDGVSAGAAALVARAITPEALAACIAGHRSAEPGHVAALTKLGLRPLVDLDLRLGEGTGALLALPIVQSAARAMHEVATFDAAGVTEKS